MMLIQIWIYLNVFIPQLPAAPPSVPRYEWNPFFPPANFSTFPARVPNFSRTAASYWSDSTVSTSDRTRTAQIVFISLRQVQSAA